MSEGLLLETRWRGARGRYERGMRGLDGVCIAGGGCSVGTFVVE